MADEKRTEGKPHDDLTQLANTMLEVLERDSNAGDVKAIVMLNRGDRRFGVGISGYEDDAEAVGDMFVHLRGILRANGKDMTIIPIQEVNQG